MHDTSPRPSLELSDLSTAVEVAGSHRTGAASRAALIFFQAERPEREEDVLEDLSTRVRVAGDKSGGDRATLCFFGVES